MQDYIQQETFMRRAMAEAAQAAAIGEVPIGAIIVRDGEVISSAHNMRETDRLATAHAELMAIERACAALGGWRLPGCDLYVTLEPCPMCAGAIINARIERVYFGASDPKAGCCGSITDLFSYPFNHHPQIYGGLLAAECGEQLSSFFRSLRRQRRS